MQETIDNFFVFPSKQCKNGPLCRFYCSKSMRNARAFFASFLFLPSASSRSCFFFFSVLRFFFRLPSVVSFSFFGHPLESLWSSFGHPIMTPLSPFKALPSSSPPLPPTLLAYSFSLFNFQHSIHFSFLLFNFSFFILFPSSYL